MKPVTLSPELLREVRKLHFETRRLANQGVIGRYRSAFRGMGVEFEEVREYVPGDDVRAIDWKVTARSRKPFIKVYREERELTVIVAVDLSASTRTATKGALRSSLIAKVGAAITLIALLNNDKVGLVTWSDQLESYHPPRRTRGAVWRVLHEVMAERPANHGTDLTGMSEFLSSVLPQKAIIFVLSDFLGPLNFESRLAVLARRHDVTAVVASDPADFILPKAGIIRLTDPETGETSLIDSSSELVRNWYSTKARLHAEERQKMFRRHKIGTIDLRTDLPFTGALRRYFESRTHRFASAVSHSAPAQAAASGRGENISTDKIGG